ncbi:MAG: glycine betaine ABC transporter substrate-binding protein [Chloroflexota bacterium]
MRTTRKLALGASLLASLAIVGTTGGGAILAQDQPTVRIGSDGFYESQLMAEIYAQALEAEGFTVDRQLGIGARPARVQAFASGQVNLVPEYIGFGLEFYTRDPEADAAVAAIETSGNAEIDAQSLQTVFGLIGLDATVLGITVGQDTNATVVRPDTAEKYGLEKMSDLAAVQDELRFGLPPSCEANAPCQGALEGAYGITWPPAQLELLPACGAEIAGALEGNAIDVAWMCSTQPIIAQNGWIVLEDDLETQPPGNLAPIVRNDLLEQIDGGAEAIAAILDPISAQITTDTLTELGVRIAVDQENIDDVATEFLAGLASE